MRILIALFCWLFVFNTNIFAVQEEISEKEIQSFLSEKIETNYHKYFYTYSGTLDSKDHIKWLKAAARRLAENNVVSYKER